MRGKRNLLREQRRDSGLIPAYAGKTGRRCGRLHPRRAHPRVCGENRRQITRPLSIVGSSPRMRGKLYAIAIRERWSGLIPAYAGKTRFAVGSSLTWPAHPRVCGENLDMVCVFGLFVGSSPRMRGKQCARFRFVRLRGLIPAYAGKTICLAVEVCASAGSSPRMRGKLE